MSPEYFENHELLETLLYYDMPLVYTFKTKDANYFLAYNWDTPEECGNWLYIPINDIIFKKLKDGGFTLSQFLIECGVLYKIRVVDRKIEFCKRYFSKEFIDENITESVLTDTAAYLNF